MEIDLSSALKCVFYASTAVIKGSFTLRSVTWVSARRGASLACMASESRRDELYVLLLFHIYLFIFNDSCQSIISKSTGPIFI